MAAFTVVAIVAGGFLHGPANMAYLSFIQPMGIGPGWGAGLAQAIVTRPVHRMTLEET